MFTLVTQWQSPELPALQLNLLLKLLSLSDPKVFLTGASEMGSSDVVSSRQMPIENLGLAKTNIQVLQSMEETTTNDPVSKSVPVSDEDDDGE